MTNVAIVGAGIAGPALAVALREVGIDSLILERRPRRAPAVGAFLTLGTNGLIALSRLGLTGATVGFETGYIDLVSGTGKDLGRARITGPDGSPVSRTMRRADLSALLRDKALARGIEIRDQADVVAVHEASDGVDVTLADGTTLRADVLVGADGIWSRTRAVIDPAAPAPAYTGLTGHGGYAPAGVVADPPGSYRMIFGRAAFFGYAVAPDGGAWWFLNEPTPDEPRQSRTVERPPEALRAHLIALVAGDRGPAATMLDGTVEFTPSGPVHTIPHLPRWHTDRLVVIGDAAHAPSPSSGQGASLALEDAVMLAARLRAHDTPREAFAAFTRARRPRVESIIRQAARVNSSKAATGIARVARDLMLPLILRATRSSPQLRDAYDYQVEALAAP